jgi:hypothetical protein
MTATASLERTALAIVPPARATGWRITVLPDPERRYVYAVVPILDGRTDGAPVFRGSQRDCTTLHRLLSGEAPTSREAAHAIPAGTTHPTGSVQDHPLAASSGPPSSGTVGLLRETPEQGGAALSLGL